MICIPQFSDIGTLPSGTNAAEMTNVQCTGTETSIDDCPHENGSGYCATSAQIRCIGTISDFYCLEGAGDNKMSRTLMIILIFLISVPTP